MNILTPTLSPGVEGVFIVFGLGLSGQACLRFLTQKYPNSEIIALDTRDNIDLVANWPQVRFILGADRINNFTATELPNLNIIAILKSPGLDWHWNILDYAKQHFIPIWGDIELFAQHNNQPVIGITGTNGKSTVTSLMGKILECAGLKVGVGGNLGESPLDFLLDDNAYDIYVLELSSYQLETTNSLHPKVGVVLNVTPDHLERYEDFFEYYECKLRLLDLSEQIVLNPKQVKYDRKPALCYGKNSKQEVEQIIDISELNLIGDHNLENISAVLAMCELLEIPIASMEQGLREFKGLPYRCQKLGYYNGVLWINDSKSTNLGSSLAALDGLKNAITAPGQWVLLLGGQAKPGSYQELVAPVVASCKAVVCFGASKDMFSELFANKLPVYVVDKLAQAVEQAAKIASSGDGVLFSPGGASFDEFKNYAERGAVFNSLVGV